MKHKTAQEWLAHGKASRLPRALSDDFDRYLENLPWAGTTGLDWAVLAPSTKFNLTDRSLADVHDWIGTTALGCRSSIAVWYSREEGGIIVPLSVLGHSLDELYRDAPGPRFAFGVSLEDGGVVRPFFSELLQYGEGDLLIATLPMRASDPES